MFRKKEINSKKIRNKIQNDNIDEDIEETQIVKTKPRAKTMNKSEVVFTSSTTVTYSVSDLKELKSEQLQRTSKNTVINNAISSKIVVPDDSLIEAMKKRKEEKKIAPNFIPFDDEEQDKGARIALDEDVDEDFAFDISNEKQKKEIKTAIGEEYNNDDVTSETEDVELLKWENSLIKKGGGMITSEYSQKETLINPVHFPPQAKLITFSDCINAVEKRIIEYDLDYANNFSQLGYLINEKSVLEKNLETKNDA